MTAQFLAVVLLAVVAPAAALNITRILEQHPEFAAFNAYLTKTNVSDLINRRQTITVLAVEDAAIVPAFAGKPLSVIKDVLSAHVILDYFGPPKLRRLVQQRKTSLLTTLFQASGRAVGQQGFLNVSAAGDGADGVAFGSAVRGAPLVSKLVGSIAARPYVISVIQVTAPIFPIGVDPNPRPPPPPAAAAPPPPPEEEEPAEPPVSEADGPVADGPEAVGAEPPLVEAPAISPVADEVDDGGKVVSVKPSGVASVDVRFSSLILGLVLIFVSM